jgi:hypothetical protein
MVYVIATRTGVLTHNGVPITVREGDRYLRDDSIVAAFPWMFDPEVEQATAVPGEKRTTRARRKPAP